MLRLKPTGRFTNKSRGEHVSGRRGQSNDFSDYRNYVSGDDIRFVDWNIFARLHRPFLKLYRQEEELHVVVLIDASSSMMFEGKFALAQSLGAAFGVMGLCGMEKVSVFAFNSTAASPLYLRPCRGRSGMARLFRFIESIESGGDAPVDAAVERFLKNHSGRGVAVILSDFLTFGELVRPMNLLFGAGLELFAVQILGPSEIDPELTGDVRFVDAENGRTLDVSSSGDLIRIYREYRADYERRISDLCKARGGRFLSLASSDPFAWIVFDVLRRRGWIE
ncbi:MAG: DUF58 domain-containing protein [Planctomycetes bacterium]|nr:DUF58 domain-containing protein [Planctomycetota bacterium]